MSLRIGADVGGTFTDVVLEADGELFLDWITGVVQGESPADVVCTDCGSPAN